MKYSSFVCYLLTFWVAFDGFSQTYITFGNRIEGVLDAPIYSEEYESPGDDFSEARSGNTPSGTPAGEQTYRGSLLEGWTVGFLAAPGIHDRYDVNAFVASSVRVTLGSGPDAGYFPTTNVPFPTIAFPGDLVTVQIRVWNSSVSGGEWSLFNVVGASAFFTARVGEVATGLRSFRLGWLDKRTLAPFCAPTPIPPVKGQEFEYVTNGGSITITDYVGPGGVVAIPSSINNLPVTEIGDLAFSFKYCVTEISIPDTVIRIGIWAFQACKSLTAVTFGNGLTIIDANAFMQCTKLASAKFPPSVVFVGNGSFSGAKSLTNVVLPEKVSYVGGEAFQYCDALMAVTIPESTTNIGYRAFYSCSNLSTINVDGRNPFYSAVEGVLFDKSQSTLIQYPQGRLGGYTIPASVGTIGSYAFAHCKNLTSVTIPVTVTNVGIGSFYDCSALTSVVMPERIARLDYETFTDCSALTGLYFTGNAPLEGDSFLFRTPATIYYLPGTLGWKASFGGRPTSPWMLAQPLILNGSIALATNQFRFLVSWATTNSVVIEATTNLDTAWVSVATNALSNGSLYFTEPARGNCPSRIYRVRALP